MNRSHSILAVIMVLCTVAVLLFINVRDDRARMAAKQAAKLADAKQLEEAELAAHAREFAEKLDREREYVEAYNRWVDTCAKLRKQKYDIMKSDPLNFKLEAELEAIPLPPPPDKPTGLSASK